MAAWQDRFDVYASHYHHLEREDFDDADLGPDLTVEEAREQAAEEFHSMPPRAQFKARRMAKRSTTRRQANREWARRQRREDVNAQVIY